MPPEPLPFDRKDFLKDRKPLSVDPVGIVPQRWREPATTPSQHNNHGSSSSCRWGGGGGLSDFRRPFSGLHGKRVGGGWHHTTVESGSNENSCLTNSVSMAFGSQKDPKGANCWETTASPNGNSLLPHNDFVKSSDQLQSVDQHAKNSGGGGSSTTNNNQILEKASSLGSSLDWKPLKWIRSGSLQQLGNKTPLRSLSEDAAPCVTPRTPDEVSSRKKQRLGWGEGLAKYEKKKVDPADDIVDKDVGGVVDGVTGSEPLLTSPSNLSDKSPSVNGNPECASPTTPYSFACSSSPGGLEEKESSKTFTMDNDTCDPSAVSCHVSENHTEGLSFSLENLEHGLSSSLEELVQSDDSSCPGRSGFVKSSTAMDKLQVWKTELTKTLEITETGIDSLENELKSLVSDGGSCPFTPASSNKTYDENCEPLAVEKTDSCPEEVNGVEDPGERSPGTTSELMEPTAKYSEDIGNDGMSGFVLSLGDGGEVPTGSSSTVSDGRREDKLYDMISASNKVISSKASDELGRMLLPTTTHLCTTKVSKAATDELLIKKRIGMRNRFLKLKERVVASKYRALRYSWKEDVHLLCTRKSSAKSSHSRKFESSSRMGYADNQKCRPPGGGGGLSLVPTAEALDYVKKLLSDSRVVRRRSALKMPCLKLDRRERLMTRFDSDNGLVEDPVGVEKERCVVSSWTEEEKEIFLDKYCLFGKDFKKIASFLEYRTTGDCVEFYYKNHKSDRFENTKKKSAFAKGKCCGNNNTSYLVTPSAAGRRLNCEGVATSLEMLGAAAASASAMVANGQQQQKSSRRISVSTRDASSSLQNDGDEETCSDGDDISCGGEKMNPSCDWTDGEKSGFLQAVRSYGKDFSMISRCVRTRSRDECKVFYSKARKCLGLDAIHDVEGKAAGPNDHDHRDDDTLLCMVDSGSVISCDKSSSSELKMEVEDLHSSDSKQEPPAESDQIVANEDAEQASASASASGSVGVKVEADTAANCLDLTVNDDDMALNDVEKEKPCHNGLPAPSSSCLFIPIHHRKTHSQDDDVSSSSSSRLSFRRSGGGSKRCSSSTDGYHHLHLPKHSLMDCVESSQVLRGYPVTVSSPIICSQEQRQGSGSGSGDVKLFGQILTNPLKSKINYSLLQENGDEKPNGTTSFNFKFDNHHSDSGGDINLGLSDVPLRTSYGFWDGTRIQTGFPDSSSILMAKYPTSGGFGNSSVKTGGGGGGSNVVVGVSDPVAAIRMHYAKTQQQYNKNGTSNGAI